MKSGDQFHALMRACLASVLLVGLIFLGSGFAVAQESPQLMDHTMCKGLNEKKEPVDRTDAFSTQDASAYSSIKIGPVYGAHKVDWNWYSPNRELYYSSTRNIDPLSKGPYYLDWDWASCLIFIKGQDAERLPGDWHVEVLVDGRLVATEKFSLISQSEKGSYTYTTLPEEKTTRDLIAEGNAFLGQGKYDEALQAYDNALQLDSQLVDAWYDKGVVLNKQGKYDQAVAAYDNAIQINPEFAYAWCNRGDSLQKKGSYEDAIKAYDKAIELDPSDAYPLNNKGVVLSKQGNYEAAIEAFDQALAIDPNNEEALSNKRTAEAALAKMQPSVVEQPGTREVITIEPSEVIQAPEEEHKAIPPTPTLGTVIAEGQVGPEGGKVEAPGEVAVEFPAGALEHDEKVVIRSLEDASQSGKIYSVDREGGSDLLKQPAKLTFDLPSEVDGTKVAAIQEIIPGFWTILNSSYDDKSHRLTTEATHFSKLGWAGWWAAGTAAVMGGAVVVGVVVSGPAILTTPFLASLGYAGTALAAFLVSIPGYPTGKLIEYAVKTWGLDRDCSTDHFSLQWTLVGDHAVNDPNWVWGCDKCGSGPFVIKVWLPY